MLSFQNPSLYQSSKCFVTYGIMGHVDPKQPPSKGKPWATLASQDFVHRVDLVVPEEVVDTVRDTVLEKPTPQFWRVVMSLQDVLAGDFYIEYVKKGDIMMLSAGRIGIDNVYSLKNGVLTMFLDKEAYERAGLVGKPQGVKGKRGLKPRWAVEFNLKGDNMIHGKKGFDRLVYASKNALSGPITWLFCNLSGTAPNPDLISQYSSVNRTATPEVSSPIETSLPVLKPAVEALVPTGREDFESLSTELYEWLSLIRLESPRISPGDDIDPFLSRYKVPSSHRPAFVRKVSWTGFLAPTWSQKLLIDVVTALPSRTWFSLSTTTFPKGVAGENSECSMLRPPDSNGEYLMWEVKGSE